MENARAVSLPLVRVKRCRDGDRGGGVQKNTVGHNQLSKLTFMLWLLHQLADYRLQNTNISGFSSVDALNGLKVRIYPFRRPPRVRPSKAIPKFGASPSVSILRIVPAIPMSNTGLRPILSERAPQYIPMAASAREKAEMRIPE